MVFTLSTLWWISIRGLWKLSDGRDWLWGRLGLILMGRVMLSKSLIQFSVDGWSYVPSLSLTWDQTMVGVVKIMATSFKRTFACTVVFSAPDPAAGHCWPTPLPEHSQASLAQSLVGSLLLSPGSWCTQGFVVPFKSLLPQSCLSMVIKSHWPPKSNSLGILSPFPRSPGWEICCGS